MYLNDINNTYGQQRFGATPVWYPTATPNQGTSSIFAQTSTRQVSAAPKFNILGLMAALLPLAMLFATIFPSLKKQPDPPVDEDPPPPVDEDPPPPVDENPPVEEKTNSPTNEEPTPDDKPYGYFNMFNNTTGRAYVQGEKENTLTVKGNQVSSFESFSGMALNNSQESFVELNDKTKNALAGKDGFEKAQTDGDGNKNELTLDEFKAYFRSFEASVKKDQEVRNGNRLAKDPVDIDEYDDKFIEEMFKKMAGPDGKVTQDEWTTFFNDLFKQGNADNTITRAELDHAVYGDASKMDINAQPTIYGGELPEVEIVADKIKKDEE